MTPYEALYGCICKSQVGLFEVGEESYIGPNLVHDAMENIKLIRDRFKTIRVVKSPMKIYGGETWGSKLKIGFS